MGEEVEKAVRPVGEENASDSWPRGEVTHHEDGPDFHQHLHTPPRGFPRTGLKEFNLD